MDPRQITSLNGPIAFYFYPHVNGQRIVLLSDIHLQGTKCEHDYKVVDWVLDLSEYDCVDFFVEHSYIKEPISKITNYTSTSTLSNIINAFEPYYINNKYIDLYNLRYHYIDARSFKLSNGTIYLFTPVSPLSKQLLTNTGYKSNQFNLEKYMNNLKNIILYLMCLNQEDDYLDFMNDVNKLALGKSIYVKSKNTKYGPSTYMTYDDIKLYMDIYFIIVKKRQLKLPNLDSFNLTFLELVLNRCEALLINIDVTAVTPLRTFIMIRELSYIPIHYYALLRMFGSYKDGKCENYNKNIIMYCGHTHTLFINEFILNYFNIMPTISIINESDHKKLTANQCIRLDEPFDYF